MESHPFKHFNFKLIKTILDFDNPISQLFVTHLNLDEEQPIKKGWILPVAFPTGIGKTHNVLNVILEKMLYLCTRQKISTNQFSWVWGLKN